MRPIAKLLLPLAVLALAALAAALLIRARPRPERREAPAAPPLVRVVEVVRRDLPLTVSSQGTVAPRTATTLVAEVAGRIVAVAPGFAEGAFFAAGEVLAEIDPRDYELALAQAEAQVAQAAMRLAREQAEAELARQEWRELGRGEGTPLALRQPQLAEARAALAAAEAALGSARLALERTAVRAPFAGRVRSKLAELGQYLAPGTPVAAVYATDYAEVRLAVPQDQLAFLDLDLGYPGPGRGGRPSVVLAAELDGVRHTWPARVVRSAGEIDPKTRMLDLFALVVDPFARRPRAAPPLPMGLFVEAEIAGRTVSDVAVLPRVALRGRDQVLVVDRPDGRLRFRTVTVLRTQGDQVVVAEGLADGEWVCVSPLDTAVDGMRVRTQVEAAEPEDEVGDRPMARPEGAP